MIARQSESQAIFLAPMRLASWPRRKTGDRPTADLWLTDRMDFGCHRVLGYLTLTGTQNVLRTDFGTTIPTRTASIATQSCQSMRIGVACCGWGLRIRG